MKSSSKLNIVSIHGVPDDLGLDPTIQFDPIRKYISSECSDLNIAEGFFRWTNPEEPNLSSLYALADSGIFSKTFYPELDKFLSRFASNTDFVVIAYSAGGNIFFRWLAERENSGQLQHMRAAVVLASFRWGRKFPFKRDNRVRFIPFNDPEIKCENIVRYLRPGILKVLIAGKDERIQNRAQSTFDDQSVCRERVEQIVVEDADHETILRHDKTKSVIASTLRNCIGIAA